MSRFTSSGRCLSKDSGRREQGRGFRASSVSSSAALLIARSGVRLIFVLPSPNAGRGGACARSVEMINFVTNDNHFEIIKFHPTF